MRWCFAFLVAVFATAFCTNPSSGGEKTLTFWTTEVEKDRIQVQRQIALEFTERTGISVRVIPVEENFLTRRVTAAFAARSLPDVLYHPVDFTMGWAAAGILDADAATQVIQRLGHSTFGAGALNLVRFGTGFAAVPVDGWVQLLLYRKDLFESKGLAPPTDWGRILQAARTLHQPPTFWGIEVATDPGQTYTQQVFEHLALSNGVRLVDPSGNVGLDPPRLREVLRFYAELARLSPRGNLYWLHTRMDYLAGRAAMIFWSPFILDELSGLRKDQPVLPDLSRKEPGFLARNTGFVSRIKGPNGASQYGQVSYLGISRDADRQAAQAWIEHLLTRAYLRWLGMAAEGKIPMRKGTPEDPHRFLHEWKDLEFGVDTKARIGRFYGEELLRTLTAGIEGVDRWGLARGKGALVSKIYGTKVIPEILKKFLDGEISTDEAVRRMNQRIRSLQ